MTQVDLLARLERLERIVEAGFGDLRADVAELRAAVAPRPDARHDPVRWRRTVLTGLWRKHYRLMSRSGAANAIAADWSAYADARPNTPPAAGTREAVFDELTAGGCRTLSARAIREDLAGA